MGRKQKMLDKINSAYEDKASNVSSETKSDVEKLPSHAKTVAAINVKDNVHQISNGAKRGNNSRSGSVVVRRSSRINSLASPNNSLEMEPHVEHVNLVEDEKEQETEVQPGSSLPEVNGTSLEEKVDYLVRTVDYLKSKVSERKDEVPGSDISYKSLYIDSQKKIEALMEDNYELVRKLEFARGKIAAYEMMKDAVGAQKEFLLVSALEKAADVAASLSPKAVQKSALPPPAGSTHGASDPEPKKRYLKRARR